MRYFLAGMIDYAQIFVDIVDNGKGVDPAILNNIFAKGSRTYQPGVARGTTKSSRLTKLSIPDALAMSCLAMVNVGGSRLGSRVASASFEQL